MDQLIECRGVRRHMREGVLFVRRMIDAVCSRFILTPLNDDNWIDRCMIEAAALGALLCVIYILEGILINT